MKATLVVRIAIDEASAKVRTGPPLDDEEDYAMSVWAGVLPLALAAATPTADPRLPSGTPLPPYAAFFCRRFFFPRSNDVEGRTTLPNAG